MSSLLKPQLATAPLSFSNTKVFFLRADYGVKGAEMIGVILRVDTHCGVMVIM
jgi:hypothetical protein